MVVRARQAKIGWAIFYLMIAWCFAVLERLDGAMQVFPPKYGDAAGIVGAVFLFLSGRAIISFINISPLMRRVLIFAFIWYSVSVTSDFIDEFGWSDQNPFIGKHNPVHRALEVVFWTSGLLFTVAGLFAALIEASEARDQALVERERGDAQEAAQKSARTQLALYTQAIDRAKDGILISRLNGEVFYANSSFLELSGLPSEDIIGATLSSLVVPAEETIDAVADQVRTSGAWLGDLQLCATGCSGLQLASSCALLRNDAGQAMGILIMIRDMTEQRRLASALRSSEELYRLLAEHSTDIIMVLEMSGEVVYVSPYIEGITGHAPADLVGKSPFPLVHPEDRDRMLARFQDSANFDDMPAEEFRLRCAWGDYLWFESTATLMPAAPGAPANRVAVALRDISLRKREEANTRALEQKLHRAQRHESLSLLASGVAHDFNNLLLVIMANAELLELEVPAAGSVARSGLKNIQTAAERAAELTRRMLEYSGRGESLQVELPLATLVVELSTLLRSTMKPTTDLALDLAENLPTVAGDPVELRQVIMNLITNAAEACPAQGGQIHVRLSVMECSQELLNTGVTVQPLDPGPYICLEVRDNGAGMTAETREHMFDPFFTTKVHGRGLGLAAVLGIVHRHGGTLTVESAPEAGTRICVYLPVRDQA